MKHGFKTEAESMGKGLRRDLGLRVEDPLPARHLATHLGIVVIGPQQLPGMTTSLQDRLLKVDCSAWSAFTLIHANATLIVYNTAHSPARQENDIMHETAHILRKHKPSAITQLDGLPFPLRDFDKDQEDEANWLSGCLLLPRDALYWAIRREMDNQAIAEHFGTSQDLVRYRRNVTGLDRQIARMGRR